MSRLANKVAIVTGAASGIGLGIAQLFTKEGAKVVFSDINSKSGKTAADTASDKNVLFLGFLYISFWISLPLQTSSLEP